MCHRLAVHSPQRHPLRVAGILRLKTLGTARLAARSPPHERACARRKNRPPLLGPSLQWGATPGRTSAGYVGNSGHLTPRTTGPLTPISVLLPGRSVTIGRTQAHHWEVVTRAHRNRRRPGRGTLGESGLDPPKHPPIPRALGLLVFFPPFHIPPDLEVAPWLGRHTFCMERCQIVSFFC